MFCFSITKCGAKIRIFFHSAKKSLQHTKNPRIENGAGIEVGVRLNYLFSGLLAGFGAAAGVAMLARMSVSAWMFFMR